MIQYLASVLLAIVVALWAIAYCERDGGKKIRAKYREAYVRRKRPPTPREWRRQIDAATQGGPPNDPR